MIPCHTHALRKKVLAGASNSRPASFRQACRLQSTHSPPDTRRWIRQIEEVHPQEAHSFQGIETNLAWQYQVLTNLKKALPKMKENAKLIDRMFKDYPEGFYVHAPE